MSPSNVSYNRTVHIPGHHALPPGISSQAAWELGYSRGDIDPLIGHRRTVRDALSQATVAALGNPGVVSATTHTNKLNVAAANDPVNVAAGLGSGSSRGILVAADGTRMHVSARKRVPVGGWPSGVQFGMGIHTAGPMSPFGVPTTYPSLTLPSYTSPPGALITTSGRSAAVAVAPASQSSKTASAVRPPPQLPVDSLPGTIGNGGWFPTHTNLQLEMRHAERGLPVRLMEDVGVAADLKTLSLTLPAESPLTLVEGATLVSGTPIVEQPDKAFADSENVLIEQSGLIKLLEEQETERASGGPPKDEERAAGGTGGGGGGGGSAGGGAPAIPKRPVIQRTTAHTGKLQPIPPAQLRPPPASPNDYDFTTKGSTSAGVATVVGVGSVGGPTPSAARPKSAGVRLVPINTSASGASAATTGAKQQDAATALAARPQAIAIHPKNSGSLGSLSNHHPTNNAAQNQQIHHHLYSPANPPPTLPHPGTHYLVRPPHYQPPGPPPAVPSVVVSNPGALPPPLAANRRFPRASHPPVLPLPTVAAGGAPISLPAAASAPTSTASSSTSSSSSFSTPSSSSSTILPGGSGSGSSGAPPPPPILQCTCEGSGATSLYGAEFSGVVR
ncbi:hypothetical protein DFJ73DRAFT_784088, partial [Zopfochytrium polystomum]